MLLQRLNDYAGRLDLPPTLYALAPVRYIVDLDASGAPLTPHPIDTADPSSPATRRGERRLVPQIQRAVGIKPLLLADNAEYTLGLAREASRPERVAACHRAYFELLERCAAATDDPAVRAVIAFLSDDPTSKLDLPEEHDRGAAITFRVGGAFVVDLASVQTFWAADNDPAGKSAPTMQCLVCGEHRPVLDRLQAKLKGVPGGQTSGTAIISANADAFESYGLKASLIAPTCASCGERFTKAANELLRDETSRIVMGGAAFIFWTREDVGFSFRTFLADPQPQEVRELIASVQTGRTMPGVDETAFYASILSGSGGRAVVRDWIDTTIGEVKQNLSGWFRRQRVVDEYGAEGRPLGLYALAAATVRDPRTDLAPPTMRALLHASLTGTPVQMDLLYQAVRRSRAEQRVNRQRAALIKLVLTGHSTDLEDAMVQLDPDNVSPAYRCGRLLAVLEEVQRRAIPGLNATIVDRFFGTASSAPASVFGRLIRGAQPHLGKIERDNRPAYSALQQRIEGILAGLDAGQAFPITLTLRDQGIFALGYYHQRAYDRAQARAAAERRRAQTDRPLDQTDPAS